MPAAGPIASGADAAAPNPAMHVDAPNPTIEEFRKTLLAMLVQVMPDEMPAHEASPIQAGIGSFLIACSTDNPSGRGFVFDVNNPELLRLRHVPVSDEDNFPIPGIGSTDSSNI